MAIVVQVCNSENLLDYVLAGGEVSLLGEQGSDVAVVSLINPIQITLGQLVEAPELLEDPVTSSNNEGENEPGVDCVYAVVPEILRERSTSDIGSGSLFINGLLSLVVLPLVEPADQLVNGLSDTIGGEVGWDNDGDAQSEKFDYLGIGNCLSQESLGDALFSLLKSLPNLKGSEHSNNGKCESAGEEDSHVKNFQLTHEVSEDVVPSVVESETFCEAYHCVGCLDKDIGCCNPFGDGAHDNTHVHHDDWRDSA